MDPTIPQQGAPAAAAPGGITVPPGVTSAVPDPNAAAQNALILQAIKSGAMGGATPPAQSMPPSPLANPNDQSGGLGSAPMPNQMNMQMAAMQNAMAPGLASQNMAPMGQNAPTGQGTDPVAAALFSQIPGSQ
jgi:hypothetical protein